MGKLDFFASKDKKYPPHSLENNGAVKKSIQTMMLLALAATQSATQAEDPQKKDGVGNKTEEVLPKKDILPAGLKDLPPDNPLVLSWEKLQATLESFEIKNESTNHGVDTYDPQRWRWEIAYKAVLQLRALSPSKPDANGHYHYRESDESESLWGEVNAHDPKNGSQLIDVILKIAAGRDIHFKCDENNQFVSRKGDTLTVIKPLGVIPFRIVDKDGKVVTRGKTQTNGVGTVYIPDSAARPCRVQFDDGSIEEAHNASTIEQSDKSKSILVSEEGHEEIS